MIKMGLSFLAIVASSQGVLAETMKLAVTTSFHNSGLSDVLLPEIKADLGLDVELLVVGTGQALRLGEAGDVDAILVHSLKAEEKFLEGGFGTHRREIMYNDFVFIGPSEDPATLREAKDSVQVLQQISQVEAVFVSRGDDSGTHKKEMSLWAHAGFDPESLSDWYRELGSGMGATLNTAAGMDAYLMSDRASWLNFGNKANLELLFSGDPILFNQYAYIPVNSEKHSHVKADLALALEGWLTGDHAKALINNYTINDERLFIFNAE